MLEDSQKGQFYYHLPHFLLGIIQAEENALLLSHLLVRLRGLKKPFYLHFQAAILQLVSSVRSALSGSSAI